MSVFRERIRCILYAVGNYQEVMKVRRLVRVRALIEALGCKDRNGLDAIRRGGCKDFPKPVKIGNRTIAWFEDEILAWMESLGRTPNKPRAPKSTVGWPDAQPA